MSDTKRRNVLFRRIIISLPIIYLLYVLFIKNILEYHEITRNPKYTIGTTTKTSFATKGNDYIDFVYYVNEKQYIGDIIFSYNIKVPNGRYFVKFSKKNPYKNYMLTNSPVPDSIKIAPPSGWDELPK